MTKKQKTLALIGGWSAGAIALIVYFFGFTDPGRGILAAFTLMPAALSAPGALEVGAIPECQQGAVWNTPDYWKLTRTFRTRHPDVTKLPPRIVMCRVEAMQTPPNCAAVETAYRRGAKPVEPFIVTVTQQLKKAPICEMTLAP